MLCCALLRSVTIAPPQAQLAALTRIVGALSLQIASSPSPSPSLPFDTHLDLNLSISTLHPSHLHYTRFPRVADLVREPVPPPPLSSSSASAFSRFCIQHPCRSGSASRGKSIPFLSSTLDKLHIPRARSPFVSTTAVANISCYLSCILARSQLFLQLQPQLQALVTTHKSTCQRRSLWALGLTSCIALLTHRPDASSES